MHQLALDQPAQQVGPPLLVVDVLDQGVLDRDAPLGLGRVVPGRVQHLADLPAGVDGHQRVAQLVVGGVQGDGQRHRQTFVGELLDRRHQADRGDRDASGGDAQPLGGGVDDAADGADHGLVVGQRLAHAHEDDVAHPAGAAGHLVTGQRAGARHDLLDDLGRRHVAGQPGLSGGAEGAVHTAAGLGGHAHGHAVGVAHQHRLDQRAVEEPPKGLTGGAFVAGDLADRGQQAGHQLCHQLVARRGRKIGHVLGLGGQPLEVVPGQLVGAEGLLAQLGDGRTALRHRQVGQVTRWLCPSGGDKS